MKFKPDAEGDEKYCIGPDVGGRCWVLYKKVIPKRGKFKGIPTWRVDCYPETFEQGLHMLMRSEVFDKTEEGEEILEALNAAKAALLHESERIQRILGGKTPPPGMVYASDSPETGHKDVPGSDQGSTRTKSRVRRKRRQKRPQEPHS